MSTFQILDDAAGLSVIGELDMATAPELARTLAELGPDLNVDMSRCTFMDSSGISVVVEAKAGCVPGLAIVNPSGAVRRVLTLCGLAELLIAEGAHAQSVSAP
jgi:anti-anti-sigma factor